MKIGILGGTFNPPHLGHIGLASCGADQLGLDLVLLVPTLIPPHKENPRVTATAEQRWEMTCLAAQADPRFRADDCELRRGGKSYTYDTVSALQEAYPDARTVFLCGTDMFLSLESWYRAEELLKRTAFAVAPRHPGECAQLEAQQIYLKKTYGTESTVLNCTVREISSTQLRTWDRGAWKQFLPPSVMAYIEKNGLYRSEI